MCGNVELQTPMGLEAMHRLSTLIEDAGQGKTNSWKQWFNGFSLDASDVKFLADEALRLLLAQVFQEEDNTPLAERAMPFADRKYAQQEDKIPYKKQRGRT